MNRQEEMKSWRSGFMRWRSREEPWGSHHEEARALKWDTSVGSTVEAEGSCGRDWVAVKARVGVIVVVVVEDMRGVGESVGLWVCGIWRRQCCIERIARAGVCGRIVLVWVVVSLFEVVMQLMSLQKIGHGPGVQRSFFHATPTISPFSPSFQPMSQTTLGNGCSSLINADLPPMRSYSAA